MLNKIYKIYLPVTIIISPLFTSAALVGTASLLTQAFMIIRGVVIPLAFTLALLYFFYGIAKYIWSVGTDKEDGKKIMIWGIIALFVMSSVWGIIYFIREELDIENDSAVPIPTITVQGS